MPRPLWKGAITFGLVHIPVELYPAEERKEFKFSMLDKRDFSPVGYKRYSKKTGKDVEWKDVVKGYEYEKDEYVVLSEEDFKRANVKASQTIDIAAFVPVGRALVLDTLRYADELRDPKNLELPESGLKGAHVTAKEVELAKRL